MTMHTLAKRAAFATRNSFFVAMATVAMATAGAAQEGIGSHHAFCVIDSVSVSLPCPTGSTPRPKDPYMAIHMDNQKSDSEVSAFWRAQTAAGAATAVGPAPAEDKPKWQRQTDSAYVTVFAHYCAPGFHDRVAMAEQPAGIEVAIYTDRFRVEYGSDCRSFYLSEIAPRLDRPREQALIEAKPQ